MNAVSAFESDRVFRLWDFRVSHSMLLIRSPKSDEDPSSYNVDLMFIGVSHLAVPTVLRGLAVSMSPPEVQTPLQRPLAEGEKVFLVTSQRETHSIIAAAGFVLKTTSPYFDSSLVLHWSPRDGEGEFYRARHVLEQVTLG